MKNYPDYFGDSGKLVKRPDGSFVLLSATEIEALKKDNKLTYEVPTVKGGKFTDLTQKPVWILKE